MGAARLLEFEEAKVKDAFKSDSLFRIEV